MAIFRSAILLIGAGWLAFQDPPPKPPSAVSDEAKAFLNQGS